VSWLSQKHSNPISLNPGRREVRSTSARLLPQSFITEGQGLFNRRGEEGPVYDQREQEHPPQVPIATRHSPRCRCDSCLVYDAWVDGTYTKRNVNSLRDLVRESADQTVDEVQAQGHEAWKQSKGLQELVRKTADQTLDKLQAQGIHIRVQVKALKQLVRDSSGDIFDEVKA